jgi:peptidoglycan/xylan/chitin deacetylase (PgdA/CDA1 family)
MFRTARLIVLSIAALSLVCSTAHAQQMAITFDDLPAHGDKPAKITRLEIADSILDTIRREKLPPVYGFINGTRVKEDPSFDSVLAAWRHAGQPLGNHTFTHLDLNAATPEQFEEDIQKNEPLLEKHMAGQDWRWLRYPYLNEGETVEKRRAVRTWLTAHHYKVAEVSMDFGDYLWNSPYARCVAKDDTAAIQRLHDSYLVAADRSLALYRELSRTVYGRDIRYVLLLHVGAFDAKMFPDLLALYRSRGVTFISLPQAIRDPAYATDPDVGRKGGGSIQYLMMEKRHIAIPPSILPTAELDQTCR